MAWPCGLASTTDTWGAFRVACPHGVDSLTLVSEGHHTTTVKLEGRAHVDVWLEPLGFTLSQAPVWRSWKTVSLSRADAGGATTAFWSPLSFKSPQRGCRVVVKYGWGLKRWRGDCVFNLRAS